MPERPPHFHFTVGSVSGAEGHVEQFDLSHELDLTKAALLYADQVKLFSAGSSILAGFCELRDVPREKRISLVRRYHGGQLAPEHLEILDLLGGSRAQRRKVPIKVRTALRKVLNQGWAELETMVEDEFDAYNARGLEEARASNLVDLYSFEHTDVEGILAMVTGEEDLAMETAVDDIAFEYMEQTFEAIRGDGTYPLFDATLGNIIGEAIREGLILPTSGTTQRARHAGLAGDVLQRLPTFEEATVAEVLDIRKELERPLRKFRGAIGQFSRQIESAAWEPNFAEETELVFREQIEPEVDEIDEAVRQNKDLMELARKVGRHGISFGGLGAFIGSAAGLPSLTGLVFGLSISLFQAGADLNEKFESIKGNQLYFYYHAREVLRR